MGIFTGIKKAVKPFVDVPRWMDTKNLFAFGKEIKTVMGRLFVPTKPSQPSETFEDALQRLHLTEADIAKRIKQFKLCALLFFGMALLLLVYGFFLLWQGAFKAFFGTLGLSLLLLGQAFRYHFWYYQMRERRLGCRLSEWVNSFKRTQQ